MSVTHAPKSIGVIAWTVVYNIVCVCVCVCFYIYSSFIFHTHSYHMWRLYGL